MANQKNPVWRFFASVKLALITLIILAITSIAGTIIKQGQAPSYYVDEYGSGLAKAFELLDLTNMYSSWWYILLLILFSINLLVCSIERLPVVWRQVSQDNLSSPPQNLEKMSLNHHLTVKSTPAETSEKICRVLTENGWKTPQQREVEGTIWLFAQKGAWSRLGVYVVHLSILIVLIGAIIGSLFGFQAYVFLPEGRTTSHIFLRQTREPFPLGFELRCDRFEKTYYPNGMVKEYRSDLTVIDQERDTTFQKSIIVNDPLSYRGYTFYQGDSYPTDEFFVRVETRENTQGQNFRVPAERDVNWPGTTASFRIAELTRDQEGTVSKAKISFRLSPEGEPVEFWVNDKGTAEIRQAGLNFNFSFRQFHSTLLLITKDPGVLVVYLGCVLMIVGLGVSLLLSHRRIWIQISPQGQKKAKILLGGSSNKNKLGFEQSFQKLTHQIDKDIA